MKQIFLLTLIVFLTIITLGKSVNFSLSGDDWFTLYRYKSTYSNWTSYFDIKRYEGNYDVANILMGIISQQFGYEAKWYYIFSLVFRSLAAISIFVCVKFLTSNECMAFFSGAIFGTSYAGIESTNWVFNMTTYVSISLLCVFTIMFFYKKESLLTHLISIVSLFFSFIFTPNRLHGIVLLVPILGFIKYRKSLPKLIFNIIILLIPIFLFRLVTGNNWDQTYIQMFSKIKENNAYVILNPFSYIGSSIMPDTVLTRLISNLSSPLIYNLGVFIKETLVAFLIISSINLVLTSKIKNWKFLIFSQGLITIYYLSIWVLLSSGNIGNFGNRTTLLETLIGGTSVIIYFCLFIFLRHIKIIKIGFFCVVAGIIFALIPWMVYPTANFPSDSRYLLIPSAFLIPAIIFVLEPFGKAKIVLPILMVLVNIMSTTKYVERLLTSGRYFKDVDIIFAKIKEKYSYKSIASPDVFLFTGPDNNYLYNAVTFGFTPHMKLINNDWLKDTQNAPFAVDNMASLKDVVSTPSSHELNRYGYKPVQINPNQVYSFNIESGAVVVDNTKQIQDELFGLMKSN